MDPRQWGGPGFPFPRLPVRFPRNIQRNTNTAVPGLHRGFGMASSNFPAHNRPPFHGDFQFAENPQIHGNSFWLGPGPSEPTPRMRTTLKKKTASPILKQLPKAEEKVSDEAQNPTKAKKQKKRWRTRNRKLKDATAANPQDQKVPSQPQNSGGAAKNLQDPIPKVVQKPQNAGGTAKNTQPPKAPSVSQPANAEIKQMSVEAKQITSPNGDTQKRVAPAQSRDADVSTQPQKKIKTEEANLPAKQPEVMKSFVWHGDTSKMFSCSLCRFYSTEEQEILRHFCGTLHNNVLQHLRIFFPRERVDFLHEYLKFKKKEMVMEQKDNIVKHKGMYQDHYFHRVQAVHCQACDVLIPDVSELLLTHLKSDAHKKNRKLIFKSIRAGSVAAAKALLVDKDILQLHKKYIQGQNPFKNTEFSSPQESSIYDVLVPEEDDDEIVEDNVDAIADARDGEDLPINHNEDPVHETRDSDSLERNTLLPEMMEPDHMTTETPSIAVNTDGTVKEEETEEVEEEEAAEAP